MDRYGARAGSSRNDDHHRQQQQLLQPWRFISGSTNHHPVSYTCSFCKREFTSVQALGGHMKVHRRDRARLRHCSPPPPPLPPSNPTNPNPNSASHAHIPNLNFLPPSFIAPLDRLPSVGSVSTSRAFTVGTLLSRCNETKSPKADNNLEKRLRLEIGCCLRTGQEELDLELWLGYA